MNLKNAIVRYIKGTILFPYYVRQIYKTQVLDRAGLARRDLAHRHALIYHELACLGAARSSQMITIRGVTFSIVPPRAIETIGEVVVRGDYDFVDDGSNFVVIDVGMNIGVTALMKSSEPACERVYAFEPVHPTFQLAQRNMELNPLLSAKIEMFNFGLSNRNAEMKVKFSLDEIMSVSSEGTFNDCFGTSVTEESIEVRQAASVLAPILAKHRNTKVYLKMDCEGAEFDILPDIEEAGLLDDIHIAVIEWHGRDPTSIEQLLRRNGFSCFRQRISIEWNVGMLKCVRIGKNG